MAESKKFQAHKSVAKIKTEISTCKTYDYGDSAYWDARYSQQEEDSCFDWFQRYSSLRPFVRKYVPLSSRILMVGCGNSAMPEDMVKDGYTDITNIDISSVVLDTMRSKYDDIPQLKYMQMDVCNMCFFANDSFDSIIDKGTLDCLLCGNEAQIRSGQMLREVSRLLRPEGVYMLITYGDPKSRMPHLMDAAYRWKVTLYIIPSPEFQKHAGDGMSMISYLEPVPTTAEGLLSLDFHLQDPESHFIYVCKKSSESEQSVAK